MGLHAVYQPELWRDLYVMLGTSAAALIGLLFVATSLHLDEIVNNPMYRVRARNNMYYLLTLLLEAGLILTPQSVLLLGSEFAVIGVVLLQFHARNLYRFRVKNKEAGTRAGFSSLTGVRFLASDLLAVAGGVGLPAGVAVAPYLIAVSFFLFLASVILSAWTIMLGIGAAEKPRLP